MHERSALAACLLAFGLSGCITPAMFDSPPWSLPVAAQPLHQIPPPGEAKAPIAATAEAGAAPAAELQPPAQSAPAPPVRTDVRGAGDGSMKVERVIVTGTAKEVPHRVPDFSREQVASMVCRTLGYRGENVDERRKSAVDAWQATVAAHDIRAAYEAGQRSLKDADAAELKRQDAVKKYRGGVGQFFFDLFGGRSKKADLPQQRQGDIVLENVDLFTFTENGQAIMAVSGSVRNAGATPAEIPPLTLEAIDRWEFLLAGQTSLLSFETLAPGEAKPFEVRFLNPPDTTAEVYAHFAPPFEYRARRDCDNFDPSTAKPEAPEPDQPVSASVLSTSPIHTAAELNLLTQHYRREAEYAWECRNGKDTKYEGGGGLRFGVDGSGERRDAFSISLGKPDMASQCAPAAQRLRWRDMFAMAEASDEAWGAARTAEEMQRKVAAGLATEADADAAGLAHRRAYSRLKDRGEQALARVGGSAPGIVVELYTSSFGYDPGNGRYVLISGRIRNTSDAPKQVDQLMVAIVDRLEQPVLSFSVENAATLAPGEFAAFSHRIASVGEPMRRAEDQPPGWQIRVGAMGR